jgi:hypothetical protein
MYIWMFFKSDRLNFMNFRKQKTDYQKLKQLINERRVLFNLKHKNNYCIKSFLIVFDNW